MPVRQAKLAELICSAYREDGLQPLPAGRKVKPRLWTRPPLYTNLTLLGEPLQPYLEVSCDLALEELVDVYEEFVAGFVDSDDLCDNDPTQWLAENLNLSPAVGKMLFAKPLGSVAGQQVHRLANIIQFAALASYNFPHTKIVTSDAFVVRVGGMEFGAVNGAFISNMHYEDYQKLPAVRMFRESLWELPRSAARRRHSVTIHDRLGYWAETQPETNALQLALAILWWRNSNGSTTTFQRMFQPKKLKPPVDEAVRRAREILGSSNPLTELRDIFVPMHMPINEFIKLFASPYQKMKLPLSEELRRKFEEALDQLSQ
jgi:hypothetical protein